MALAKREPDTNRASNPDRREQNQDTLQRTGADIDTDDMVNLSLKTNNLIRNKIIILFSFVFYQFI